ALSRSEQFIEKNQKNILIGLAAIVIIVAGTLFFRHSYLAPKEEAAQKMIFIGEQYFAIDSFKVALQGNGAEYIGFEGIIDEYGATKTADLAAAYAGLCYKNMGNYEKAIDYLSKSDADDIMVSPALTGAIGDCYVELGKADKAVSFFEKAADSDNELLAPIYLMKAARVYESLEKYNKAVKIYERIKKDYPNSQEGLDVEKYIERAKTK
ncbi:MAG: tetratricopeptide repeat protein, partial [Bacteroidales bacterium]|nr:tetratricopeptide repeat protein [Bacteroidales bacterium]